MAISSLGPQYVSASWTGLLQYSSSGEIYTGDGTKIITLSVTSSGNGSSSGVYGGTSPTTTTVGGLTTGTSISGLSYDSILQSILCPYNTPSFSLFSITGQSTSVDVGYIVSGSKTFTWVFNFSSNVSANTLDITDTTNSTSIATNISTISPASYTLSIVSKSAADSNVWTISADPTQGAEITRTFTVSWKWRNYFAASATVISDDSSAQLVIDSDVITSSLDDNKAWSVTCTSANNEASKYTYIIYPATYGDLSTITQNGSLPVLSAFTKVGDFTVSNVHGKSTSFRVYKSNAPGAFSNGTTLAIT